MITHTPGPWWPIHSEIGGWSVQTYRDNETAENFRIRNSGASITGFIGDHTEERTHGNEEANARLIAAAPDLLEALVALLEPIAAGPDKFPRMSNVHEFARAAIAKARGEA